MYSSASINAAAVAVAAARHPVRRIQIFFPVLYLRIILSDAKSGNGIVSPKDFPKRVWSREILFLANLNTLPTYILVASIALSSALPLNGSEFQYSTDLFFIKI